MTLLEVLIASVLSGVLLSSLFTLVKQNVHASHEISLIKKSVLEKQFLQSRLIQLFHLADPSSFQISETNPEELTFYYYQALSPDKSHVGEKRGVLTRTNDCVTLQTEECPNETLFTKVRRIQFDKGSHFLTLTLVTQDEEIPFSFPIHFSLVS